MKKITYIFLFPIALLVLSLASCEKAYKFDYEAAEAEDGAQVYFSSELPDSYDLSTSESSFTIEILRIDSSSSLTVGITATLEDDTIFTVPSSVTFAAGSTSAELEISYDPDGLEGGVYEEITLTLEDETTLYGSSAYTFEAGLARTWLTLGTGIFYEYFWYGWETPVTIYYYEQDSIYHCIVYGTDGTSASYGGALGLGQDFEFLIYMDELYNGYPIVEVPRQYTGYCYENGICDLSSATYPIYAGDYYDIYYYRYITYGGYTLDDYPQFADYITFLNYYNPQGYYYPGWFNTDTGVIETNAHWYVYYADGSLYGGWLSTSYDYTLWCELDGYYIPDYTAEITYDGKLIDASDAEYLVSTVTLGTDVASANVSVVSGSSVSDLTDIIAGTATPLETITESGTVYLDASGLTTGYYTLVVVTFDEDGDAQEYATATFLFKVTGESEVDPLMLDYTYENIDTDLEPDTRDGYYGTYSVYAKSYYDSDTERVIKASGVTLADGGVDDYSYEWVTMTGFWDGYGSYYGFTDETDLEFYYGDLYFYCHSTLGYEEGSSYYFTQLVTGSSDGSSLSVYGTGNAGYTFQFYAPVYEGYLALIDYYAAYGYTYGFNGIALRAYYDEDYTSSAGYVDIYTDIMLVADDADASAMSIASQRTELIKSALAEPRTNFVETDKAYVHSIIESVKAEEEGTISATASKSVLSVGSFNREASFCADLAAPAL